MRLGVLSMGVRLVLRKLLMGLGWRVQFLYGEAGDGHFCPHIEIQQQDFTRGGAAVTNTEHHDSKYPE